MLAPAQNKQSIKCKLKKGDEVIVIAGKSRGKTAKIERVDRKHDRVYLEGVNFAKRHTKPSMENQDGGIVEKQVPLHVSNVSLVDPKTKKPTRIGYKVENGVKVRFAKKSGTILG